MSKLVRRSEFKPMPSIESAGELDLVLTANSNKIPRNHHNCREIFGVSRPGKTAADKANGSWKPNAVRKAAKRAAQENK